MKRRLAIALAAACGLAGCTRDSRPDAESGIAVAEPTPAGSPADADSGAASAVEPDPGNTPATAVSAPVTPAAGAAEAPLEGAVHLFMTSQLRRFIEEKGRMPGSFSEFAGARMDSVPFPPDGMKYVIDTATREVKVVKK